jgi:mRNA interferase RelE/StbE
LTNYSVELKPPARKELEALPDNALSRVVRRIDSLGDVPRPAGCKKLKGYKDQWRVRVRDYRVVYIIDDAAKLVSVTRIAHRREFTSRPFSVQSAHGFALCIAGTAVNREMALASHAADITDPFFSGASCQERAGTTPASWTIVECGDEFAIGRGIMTQAIGERRLDGIYGWWPGWTMMCGEAFALRYQVEGAWDHFTT